MRAGTYVARGLWIKEDGAPRTMLRSAVMTRLHLHATPAEMLARLPGPAGERWVSALERGTRTIELYAPRGEDPQRPHTRDEVYVVVQGRGHFRCDETRHPVAPGDVLFVPAGVAHCFEDFTDDLAVWGIFFGPEGGEPA
jgi:mannose-6-phosphate isomerase-like protein (cupin superfamily)